MRVPDCFSLVIRLALARFRLRNTVRELAEVTHSGFYRKLVCFIGHCLNADDIISECSTVQATGEIQKTIEVHDGDKSQRGQGQKIFCHKRIGGSVWRDCHEIGIK